MVDGSEPVVFKPTRAVDILFVIDDSSFTTRMQDNLLRNFPTFLTRLLDPPGLPSLHLAVISTDLGAGDGSVAGCDATGGKNGIFQYTARGTCPTSGLDPGATFISDIDGVRNYSGNLADVFSCIAALGESGCGFEHQLAAITRALGADGRAAPAENQGFLRPDAFLVIVVVSDEDDCSAPPDSPLFDTTANTTLESPLGPPGNFRCNEFGHLCNGARPPRLPPSGNANDVVTLEGCVAAEDQGMLIPVSTVAAQIRSLKRFPDKQIWSARSPARPPRTPSAGWIARGTTSGRGPTSRRPAPARTPAPRPPPSASSGWPAPSARTAWSCRSAPIITDRR